MFIDTVYRPLLYRGSVDCLIKTVRQEGFFALYKGLFPTYCRMVSHIRGEGNVSCVGRLEDKMTSFM